MPPLAACFQFVVVVAVFLGFRVESEPTVALPPQADLFRKDPLRRNFEGRWLYHDKPVPALTSGRLLIIREVTSSVRLHPPSNK